MHAHKKARAFYALASLLLFTSAAEARRVNARFFLDGAAGVSIPIADRDYSNTFWPSPKLSPRLGAELWLSRHFGLGPELSIDGVAMIARYDNAVHPGKGRFQVGLRILAGFGHGHAFFARFLVGEEQLGDLPSLATELGVGMQLRFARRGVAGFTLGFPLSIFSNSARTFVDVDFDVMGFIGFRS